MSTLLPPILTLAVVAWALRVAVRGATLRSFSMRSINRIGSDFGMSPLRVVAVVNIAQLVLDTAKLSGSQHSAAGWIVIGAIALVVTTVVAPRQTDLLLGLAGLAAMVVVRANDGELEELVALVAVSMMLVWLLGFVRGVVRVR